VFALPLRLMIFDYLDRQVIFSMLPLIGAEWDFGDTQVGALISVVPLTGGHVAIPIAFLGDRWSRVQCIFGMALIWSLPTMAE
jgi:MFS family permease